jgi:lysophospholipase L1-like esterase
MGIGGVVLCTGDSLTHGARDEFGLSFPELLGRKLSDKHRQSWIGVEHGINGQTSADLLRRMYGHLKAYPEASEVCLWIGSNDAKVNVATPPDVYRENVKSLVRMARFRGKPVFVGLIPHQKGFGAPDYMDGRLVDEYNRILLEDIVWGGDALEPHKMVWYVDLRGIPESMKCDGIHLTHEGNHWVANEFMKVIELSRMGWHPEQPMPEGLGVEAYVPAKKWSPTADRAERESQA